MTDHQDYRWNNHAIEKECHYCGNTKPTIEDPFGLNPACRECWELIAYGSEDDKE